MVGGYTSQLLSLTMQAPSAMKLLVVASFTVINLVGLVEVERISSFFRCSLSSCSAWPSCSASSTGKLSSPFNPIFAIGIWINTAAAVSPPSAMWRRASARCRSCLVLRAAHLACLAAYPAGSWTQWGIDGFSSDVLGYGTIFSTVLGTPASCCSSLSPL